MAASHADALMLHIHRLAQTHATCELGDRQLLERFAIQREEEAFAALMHRHARLVWGVCRHVLPSEHDAEDAFQATFLVLARRAASIRKTEAVAAWLHGVAHRIAVRAKQTTAKRQARERWAAAVAQSDSAIDAPQADAALRELQALLDEEVARLPQKYRDPFVACCLEGRCWKDAAAEFGWKEGTLSTRIAQARKLLQARLVRRGLTLSAALTAAALWRNTAAAAVPATLKQATVALAAGRIAGGASLAVTVLAESAFRTPHFGKVLGGLALMLTLGLSAASYHPPAAIGVQPQEKPDLPAAEQPPQATDPNGDPLPPEAIARLGTMRLPNGQDRPREGSHSTMVYQAVVSPDCRTIITASRNVLFSWDAASGRLRRRWEGPGQYVNGMQLIDGGRKLVTSAYQDNSLRVWDLVAQNEAGKIDLPNERFILRAVAPNGKTVAVGGTNGTVLLLDAHTGKEVQGLRHTGGGHVYGTGFSPDGGKLTVCYSEDNLIRLWNLATGKVVGEYTFQDEDDKQLRRPPKLLGNGRAVGRPVYYNAVSPYRRLLALGSQLGFLEVRDLASGQLLRRVENLVDGVCPMAFSPDGKTLAWSGWKDFSVHLVEVATGRERHCFVGHRDRVLPLAFSADGKMLISGSVDTTALVWDLTGRLHLRGALGKPLSADDLDAGWIALANDDAAKAFRAIQQLSGSPKDAVPYLGKRLKPATSVGETRIAKLIADLDDDSFAVRENATSELEKLDDAAIDQCRKALEDKPSAEVRRRLDKLLARQAQATWSPERLRTLRALEILEWAGTTKARQILQELADGDSGDRLTREARASLERLTKRIGVR